MEIQIKQAQSKEIDLKVELNTVSGPIIFHDKDRIMQVMLNL